MHETFLEVFHDFQSLWEPCICNEGAGLMAVNIRHGREKKKIESPPLEVLNMHNLFRILTAASNNIWTQCTRFRYLSHWRAAKALASLEIWCSEGSGESGHIPYAQTRQSLRCSHTQSRDVDESSDQNLDLELHWIRQHERFAQI